MSHDQDFGHVEHPATTASLVRDLRALGVESGMTLMVHSSLSQLGYVVGGAQAVVLALLEAVGPSGTLMMPTHSSDWSDPAAWVNPPVPESWWATIRDEMPAYDPLLTPTRMMGAIVETFRHVPGVKRSSHPEDSAAAIGPNADALVGDHPLDDGLGEHSPQGNLYRLDGHILLLGVGHGNNTSLHLCEQRAAPPDQQPETKGASMLVDGERRWVTFRCFPTDDADFVDLGDEFAHTGRQRSGPVGATTAHLMRSRDLVDFGTAWMRHHRNPGTHHDQAD